MKEDIITILALIFVIVIMILGLSFCIEKYNSEEHSDDITVAEWISPDGVHYWYRSGYYQAMLAPRYDAEGNLVIDEVK